MNIFYRPNFWEKLLHNFCWRKLPLSSQIVVVQQREMVFVCHKTMTTRQKNTAKNCKRKWTKFFMLQKKRLHFNEKRLFPFMKLLISPLKFKSKFKFHNLHELSCWVLRTSTSLISSCPTVPTTNKTENISQQSLKLIFHFFYYPDSFNWTLQMYNASVLNFKVKKLKLKKFFFVMNRKLTRDGRKTGELQVKLKPKKDGNSKDMKSSYQ